MAKRIWAIGLLAAPMLALLATQAPRAAAVCVPPPNYSPKAVGDPLAGNACVENTVGAIIPNPHVEACSTTLGDEIWVVSGSINSWSNNGRPMMPTARTDIYHPSEDRWYAGPPVNVPRINYPNVYNVNGTLFLVGGYRETSPDSGSFLPCDRVEVCRPDGAGFSGLGVNIAAGNKRWHLLPAGFNMPPGTRNLWNRSNAVVGNTLYLFTPGQTLSFNTVSGVWRTNLATRAGVNGNFSCAIALNNLIYISGGCGGPSPGCPEAGFFAEYNPSTNTFRDLPRFPAPGLAEHSMEIVGGNKLLVVGGDFKGNALYYYEPVENRITSREALIPAGQPANLYSRSDHVSGIYAGKVWIVGGIRSGTTNVQPPSLGIGLPVD